MLETKELFPFLLQGFPILLCISYLLFPSAFVKVSKHPLGKMIAVALICMYTYRDMTYGLFACLLTILFYHREMESFLSESTMNYEKYLPKSAKKENSVHFDENNLKNTHLDVEEAYPVKTLPVKRVSESLFRKDTCVNSKVRYKGQDLKNHVVTHVHPELNFRDGECNPCDRTCHFTISSKQSIENKLKPVNTKDHTLAGGILTFLGFPAKEQFGLQDTKLTPFR